MVLVVALILLAVLTLIGLYGVRTAITSDQVSQNVRASAYAQRTAEAALHYCESQLYGGQLASNLILDQAVGSGQMPTQWMQRANWFGNSPLVTTVPANQLAAENMRVPLVLPRCMVERFSLAPLAGESPESVTIAEALVQPVLITAVGFSADYALGKDNFGISGSEVWLQSVFTP